MTELLHPATVSSNIINAVAKAAEQQQGVWTEGVETIVGVLQGRFVAKTLPNGKASFTRYYKLNGKTVTDKVLHSTICAKVRADRGE